MSCRQVCAGVCAQQAKAACGVSVYVGVVWWWGGVRLWGKIPQRMEEGHNHGMALY